ncbi:MAG: elongation factor 1-beta [Thermoplasmatota archaeon]
MGGLVVVFKLMPEGVETDLEAVKNAVRKVIPASAKLQGFQVKPIAFGLKSLEVTLTMEDAEGGPDAVEEAFGAIEGVQSAQVAEMGRY